MKNNVILGLQGFKKMLKSISFLALSLVIFFVDAGQPRGRRTPRAVPRNVRGQVLRKQTPPQQQQVVGGGPVVTPVNKRVQQVEFLMKQANIQRNQLSPEGQIVVREVEAGFDWESFWDRYVDKTQNPNEKAFLKELRSALVKKKEKVEASSIQEEKFNRQEATIQRLERTIDLLNRRLAMQDKGFFGNMYEYVASINPALSISGAVGAGTLLLGGYGFGGVALAAVPVLAVRSGLNYVADKLSTGQISDAIAKALGENVITQYINDSGRYPTFASRIDGINNDILNTSNLNEKTFEDYRNTVLNQIIEEKDAVFEKNPAIKASQKQIDDHIAFIRAKHFSDDPKEYMTNLKGIKNIKDITEAQAIISEYLRAAFREKQAELMQKPKEEAAEKPKTTGFWSWFGY